MTSNIDNNDDVYNLIERNLGVAIILNFKDFESNYANRFQKRHGADKDVERLNRVLKNFGFDVRIYEDLTTNDVKVLIKNLTLENHENNNSLMVVVMSHGTEDGDICTWDTTIKIKEIWEPFTDTNLCPSLVGKPKIFLFQACRGKLKDYGAVFEGENETQIEQPGTPLASRSHNVQRKIPSLADILIHYSSAEGYPSFKNSKGSWFIQSICEHLEKVLSDERKTDLMAILLRVNRDVAFSKQALIDNDYNTCKQMPVIVSMLTKSFMLGDDAETDSDD